MLAPFLQTFRFGFRDRIRFRTEVTKVEPIEGARWRVSWRRLESGEEGSDDYSAVFVANDQMALGAIHALREHQLRVPQDVSVVGFDDIPEAAYFSPPLTTIRQDFAQLGSSAVHALLERIHDPEVPIRQHIIEPQFVIRHSTAPR